MPNLGHVVLAGARPATLDLYGDGLLSLDVTNQVTQTPAGATALVTNSGVIIADGGTVQLTARAADGVVQKLVQAGGDISAATTAGHTGTIALNGIGGSAKVYRRRYNWRPPAMCRSCPANAAAKRRVRVRRRHIARLRCGGPVASWHRWEDVRQLGFQTSACAAPRADLQCRNGTYQEDTP